MKKNTYEVIALGFYTMIDGKMQDAPIGHQVESENDLSQNGKFKLLKEGEISNSKAVESANQDLEDALKMMDEANSRAEKAEAELAALKAEIEASKNAKIEVATPKTAAKKA